jgi:hypothetical protein
MTRPALPVDEETAPSEGAEIRITDLARVTLGPGDKLLVRIPGRSVQDRRKVYDYVKPRFPDHEVLVLPADCEVSVIQALAVDE